jgi:wyosine [tRNA(Phe)-imidazoG37] synthetase (radical SAM superfamily)
VKKLSHLFGPVPSRRLGRSLGVDPLSFKTCSYDCLYCQLGVTTCKTVQRKEWVPLNEILDELSPALESRPDYITLSGSGEPTLYGPMGELVRGIKTRTDTPIALLTNGSLLWKEDLREALRDVDLACVSLDAADEQTFRTVNRPHEDVPFDRMLQGLVDFRKEFKGQYWLEILLLDGLSDSDEHVASLVECVRKINPDRVQLNTVSRPPAEQIARAVPQDRMFELAQRFEPHAEVIADFRGTHDMPEFVAGRKEVLRLLQRRPCTVDDIARGLCMHVNEAVKYLEELGTKGLLTKTQTAGRLYYSAAPE